MKAFSSFGAAALVLGCTTIIAADIKGTVSGPNGPEAGVWVIAETKDTPTTYAKIVVTDDKGRFLVPDLPKGSYDVWVRGYGLVDSPKVKSAPGKTLSLKAVPAPSPKEAAEYYPAIHWFSMLRVPEEAAFPLGPVQTQGQWLNTIKTGACGSCHALSTPGMRKVPDFFMQQGKGSSEEAWRLRLQAGSARALMARDISRLDGERAIKLFADWTDRVAKGELPKTAPKRPEGVERNVVVTTWEWGRTTGYLHDLVSTDRRNPRLNAHGPVYGSPEDSTDYVPVVHPRRNFAEELLHPVRDPATPSVQGNPFGPSAVWGPQPIWTGKTLNHNPMLDENNRAWFTSRISPDPNPDFCKAGSSHPAAKAFPLNGGANRHLSFYDPKSKKWTLIRTCFPTHHLNFASDKNQTLWTSPGVVGPAVIGWLDRAMYEKTGDEAASQAWTPHVIDYNGDGKRGEYTQPDQPADAAKDRRLALNLYAVAVSPKDGTIWGTAIGYPGQVVRVVPGPDPIHTALTEVYEPPLPHAFGPRGGDVDSKGVYWVPLASGHLASFDREKCKVKNGPSATGKHCPEGWTLHAFPGPQLPDVKTPGSAEASYYVWVDWHDAFGLGKDVPYAMGSLSDVVYAFKDGKFVALHIPYPGGVFAKNVDARVDDPKAGWKGRAMWTTYGSRTVFHNEGGRMAKPRAVKIQMRPNPLAN